MKNLLFTFIFVIGTITSTLTQTETLIASDYIETYDWFGAWYFNNPTTGYFTDISVTPTLSAVIWGDGNNTYEQDWYVLPSVTVDPTKDHIFRMRLAAQTISSPTAATAGLDGGDYITVQLSQDGGSYVSELRVAGFSNANWDYSSTAVASKVADGSITEFRPSSGGDRTSLGDGYSYVELIIPAGPTTIAIDIQARANRPGEDWWMDNFELYEVSGVALPVTLLYFEGSEINGVNSLEWATASECYADYFEIEWSEDGNVWWPIGDVAASGWSSSEITYTFRHEDYKPQINYYRLSQYDFDGAFETFDIIAIDNSKTKKRIVKYVSLSGQEIDPLSTIGIVIGIFEDGTSTKMFLK